MSFRTGSSRPVRPPPPKGKGGLSLGGFSFKQLEEDEEEEEDLSVTGKYDKILDESHKSFKQPRDSRLSSTSSNSSTSSAHEDVRQLEKSRNGTEIIQKNNVDNNLKQSPINMEPSDSPLKKTAKAKLESSKELFSGLKGKITDKISKTIEEFSTDSTDASPYPENENLKESPIQIASEREVPYKRSNSFGPVVKESVTPLHATPMAATSHPLEIGNLSEDEGSEDLTVTESSKGEKGDSSMFYDPENKVKDDNPDNILVLEEHFTNDPHEDFTGMPSLSTSTKLKPRSKIKQLIPKKSAKTSVVASLSGLTDSLTGKDEVAPTLATDSKPVEKKEKSIEKKEKFIEKKVISIEQSDKSQVLSSKPADNSQLQGDVSQHPQPPNSISIFRQLSTDYASIPYRRVSAIIVVLFAYMIVPMPSFISGLTCGFLLASAGWAVYICLMQPPHPVEPLILPPIQDTPPPVPEMKQTVPSNEHMYKGWMNELSDYNVDEYHINKTYSIYVSLEGTHLRLQRPKNPAPKRAMWDEAMAKPQFINQRHFDLPGSKVFLSPPGLVKKRIWSKKYPICISFSSKSFTSDGKEALGLKHTYSDPSLEDKQKERLTDMGFEIVTEQDKYKANTLYLFARTGREKEEWFKRFSAAARGKPLGNHILEMKQVVKESISSLYGSNRLQRENSSDSIGSGSSQLDSQTDVQSEGSELLSFSQYMGRLMPSSSASSSRASSPTHSSSTSFKNSSSHESKEEAPNRVMTKSAPIICDNQLFWLNAVIGRCFFDFLRDKWWIGKVTEKLQKKLSKIHVPYFIEELQVSSIEMGYEIPAIRHAGKPYMDERGFWVDLDITYSGGFKMTIETKMNLMRLKKTPQSSSVDHSVDQTKSPITDSEEEDSAESSTDEEEETVTSDNNTTGGGTSKKFMRYLNKITQSRYFQQATEYKVVRRAMENVSNTPLTLTVTVNSLVGKLAVNIPPPPSDRLWYGFRGNPRLRLSAKPQVGERAVTFTHVTDWIEKKLAVEFQRVFVMPNMDDLVIPILVPGEVNGTAVPHSMSL